MAIIQLSDFSPEELAARKPATDKAAKIMAQQLMTRPIAPEQKPFFFNGVDVSKKELPNG